MALPGFLNANRHRAFPFVRGTVGLPLSGPPTLAMLPHAAVADCGFVAGEAAMFDSAGDRVYLQRLRRSGATFHFDFGSSAPGLAGSLLTFTRALGGPDYETEWVDSDETSGGSGSASVPGCAEALWSGYMISGRIDDLAALLPADGELVRAADAATVEPALVQNLGGAYVKALSLANDDRTRAAAPDDCPEVAWPHQPAALFVSARCLQGDVLFRPGFNATLRQDAAAGVLALGAAPGAGAGQPCAPVPLFAGEAAPDGSGLLEGGPQCNEVLRSVNGLGGPRLELLGGRGVVVEQAAGEATVVIDVSMLGLLRCGGDASVTSVSESLSY